LHHVNGLVLGVLGPLHVGSGLHNTGRQTPAAYAAAGGSLYFGVPTVWARVAGDPTSARALSAARLLVSGSAALPPSVFDALVTLTGHQPVERYGMTETLITVSARADSPRTPGYVGTPLAGTSTELVDDADAPLSRDGVAMGHLLVRGPTVFDGYLHGAEGTSFTTNGWFRTGDIATIDEDGRHRIVGRAATDLIKSGGYRIGAGEVEDALLAHPSVSEAAVVGLPDDDLGQRIVAFVVATDHDEAALIDFVGQQLSWHKRPRAVVFVDALPRNAMGKVEKARLQGSAGPTMSSPTRG
jgi:fatty acid CoA ligase FadD36